MLLNRLRTVVGADHGQYVVADANSGASFSFTTGGTGLVGPEGDIAVVGTGTAHGPVRLTIEAHDVQPDLDPDAWDEVVDVSVELPSAGLTIRMLMSGPAATVDLPTGGGAYWLRAQARGRDDARDDPVSADGEPAEEHLIVVWPTARLPDVRTPSCTRPRTGSERTSGTAKATRSRPPSSFERHPRSGPCPTGCGGPTSPAYACRSTLRRPRTPTRFD